MGGVATIAQSRYLFLADTSKASKDSTLGKRPMAFRGPKGKRFLSSLLIPGWGQYQRQHWLRAGSFALAEALGWYLNITLNRKGSDYEERYIQYADEHWDYNAWLQTGQQTPDGEQYCGYYLSHEIPYREINGVKYPYKDQHYYENIGKYNEFYCGWDDYADHWRDSLGVEYTPHKVQYIEYRDISNSSYRQAQRILSFILLNHFVAAFEAAFGPDWNIGGQKATLRTFFAQELFMLQFRIQLP